MKHPIQSSTNTTMFWLIGGFTVFAIILIGFVAVGEQKRKQKAQDRLFNIKLQIRIKPLPIVNMIPYFRILER